MGLTAAAALGGALVHGARAAPPTPLWSEKRFATPLDPDAPVAMSAFSKLARELSPAVVNISTVRKRPAAALPLLDPRRMPNEGLGSGFIIHADGYVLTNAHVIADAQAIKVKLANEHEYDARVVATYRPLDVALLAIEPAERLTVAPLGRSTELEIGEWVIAIGNPFGLAHTVTAGIVSAKGRRDIVPSREAMHAGFIQTDASINPGNSGGPLINIRGEVVGINTAINPAGQGIGFAVPIDMIKTILGQLAAGKVERSYLGVRVGEVPRTDNGRRPGALVEEVVEGSPAARAGLRRGDVIERWNGKVLDDWHDVPWFASTAGTGATVKLGVRRDDRLVELPVTLAAFPEEG
ncbi:MAG: trypsin-like peptidase domain-containing protein [Deltaproteobacteria bacterium]|nr:trypsin-like peptidase domain-containing protein [Deltaproteobacteria bacterium]